METTKTAIDTYAGYASKDEMFFSSTERMWHNRVLKLAKENPTEVEIIKYPQDNDGVIYAKMPVSYLQIKAKKKRDLTEEERAAIRERLKAGHKKAV